MVEAIIKQYDFNLAYAQALVADLSDAQLTHVPAKGLVNHPAFTLGHLISGSADLASDLGADFEMPDAWKELFIRMGPGDPRMPDQAQGQYPSKVELLAELSHQHEKVKGLLRKMTPEQLEEKVVWRFSNTLNRMIDLATFMCINHEAMHLGQLAAWRRALDLPSALATMPHTPKPYEKSDENSHIQITSSKA